MISLEPSSRLSFSTLLSKYRQTAFPEIFYTFLHPFLNSLNKVSSPLPPPTTASTTFSSSAQSSTTRLGSATPTLGVGGGAETQQQTLLRTDSDERIERVWNEWEIVQKYLDESLGLEDRNRLMSSPTAEKDEALKGKGRETDLQEGEDIFPIKLNLPGMEGNSIRGGCTKGEQSVSSRLSKFVTIYEIAIDDFTSME